MNIKADQLIAYICSYKELMRPYLEMEYKGIIITSSDNILGMDMYELTLQTNRWKTTQAIPNRQTHME